MPAISKRFKKIHSLVDRTKSYEPKAALDLVKKTATAKFDESVDVAVNLGIDSKKSDQVVRGSVVLQRISVCCANTCRSSAHRTNRER